MNESDRQPLRSSSLGNPAILTMPNEPQTMHADSIHFQQSIQPDIQTLAAKHHGTNFRTNLAVLLVIEFD
jgi:hypothetical protein